MASNTQKYCQSHKNSNIDIKGPKNEQVVTYSVPIFAT
jgi:hypothetical protein